MNYLHKYYNVFGTTVELCFNSSRWMESMSGYLAVPCIESQDKAEIQLTLLEIGPDEADQHLPLPNDGNNQTEAILQLDVAIPYVRYIKGQQRWTDFAGYGRTWMDFSEGKGEAVRFRDSVINPYYSDIILGYYGLINLMNKTGFYGIHASCVEVNGKGVVFTGKSGRGKSTAAYAMLRRGHPILTDDRLMLVKRGAYYGISITDIIKLRRAAIHSLFPELRQKPSYQDIDGECHYKITKIEGLKYIPSTEVCSLVTLEQTGQRMSRVEKISPARVVGELFPVTMGIYGINMGKKFHFIMDFLLSIDCYHVCFGTDMEHFGQVIEELVRGQEHR